MILCAQRLDVPPVFLAPNRFPGPCLGPFARPSLACVEFRTKMKVGEGRGLKSFGLVNAPAEQA